MAEHCSDRLLHAENEFSLGPCLLARQGRLTQDQDRGQLVVDRRHLTRPYNIPFRDFKYCDPSIPLPRNHQSLRDHLNHREADDWEEESERFLEERLLFRPRDQYRSASRSRSRSKSSRASPSPRRRSVLTRLSNEQQGCRSSSSPLRSYFVRRRYILKPRTRSHDERRHIHDRR